MAENEGFEYTGNIHWLTTASENIPKSNKQLIVGLQSADVKCLKCGTKWNARDGVQAEAGRFKAHGSGIHIVCPNAQCGQDKMIRLPPLPDRQ